MRIGSVAISWLALLLSAVGLFLSLWIVIPAPVFALLPLSVGAPEISPWLLGANAIALLIAGWAGKARLSRIALGLSALALVLSSLPSLQLPAVVQQANLTFQQQLGVDPATPIAAFQPRPFRWRTAFTGIPLPSVRETVGIPFAEPDGVPLTLAVYQPLERAPHPTLIAIYGGAWQRGSPTQDADLNRYLAGQGYTVIAIDYRHAPEYQFPAQLEDVRGAIAFIRAHAAEYDVDPARMAVLGRSAGAHLAMLLAYSDEAPPLRGVVNFYGPVDLATAYRQPPVPDPIDTRAVLTAFLGNGPDQQPERYQQASPLYAVRPQLPPTLMFYGGRDHVVQAQYGRALAQQLLAAGNSALYIKIPWADHAFDAVFNGPSSQLAIYYTERFLAQVLK
ncbi:alpha/beta hydrolase [Pseudanabaena sp. FACHB-2040]|uniref:alpha/beta hydrolase n=1 Tax=Pseudanabaena sp. FACHB-2040 TaxID=2692859 RepID=UPI001684334A|nr:alpha/beta hydrolase [Pseudanabaena sp. FACHB-2040]MBD2256837.1 alpha/beta hydrolase [Pseudanabaena sp. FACHB-2040]